MRLALATEPVTPSPQLKAGLMAAIRKTPQLSADAAAETASNAALAEPVEEPSAPMGSPAARRAQARWFTRPVAILVAVAAAAALFFGGTMVGQLNASNSVAQAQAASLVELSAAADVQRAQSTVAGGGQATLIWSLELRRSAVVLDALPALPAGKTYELWYMDAAGAATPAGTFEAAGTGSTWRVLEGKMSGGDTVGITIEPDGGSAKPTTKPILAIASS